MASRARIASAVLIVVALAGVPIHFLVAAQDTSSVSLHAASLQTIPGPVAAPSTTVAATTTTPAPSTTVSPPPVATPVAKVAPRPAPAAPLAFTAIAGQEAILSIPSLGMHLGVVLGGQATIDRGVVTHYQGPGWRPPVPAGAPGTYWLAAHHTTHGAPFGPLPGIKVGALIIIETAGGPITYRVTGTEVVGTTASNQTVYGSDTTTPRILLQTCEGSAYRLLVHGVRIS